MKRIVLSLVFALVLLSSWPGAGFAAQKLTGFGVILGNLSGVSFKQFLGRHFAFDLAFGAPNGYNVSPGLGVQGDFMWEDELQPVSHGALLYHLGAGFTHAVGTTRNHEVELGLRLTGGLEFFFPDSHFAVFGEAGPAFIMANAPGGRFQLAVGVRYYL